MKIALIGTTAASVLGFRADLISSLVKEGHQVFAFALDYESETRAKVRLLGAEPIDYKFSRTGLNPLGDIVNTYKLTKLLKVVAPDLVFSYFTKPVIFGTFAAVLAGVKRRLGMLEGLGYVFTEQPDGASFKGRLLKFIQVFLYRFSFPFLERLILLNKDDRVDLVERYRLKVSEISILGGIGLALSNYPYSIPPREPVSFIFIGRLLAEKGVNEFIQAARLVKQQCADAKFVILGGLDEANPGGLTAMGVSALVSEGVVDYRGHVENVVGWISGSSVFVLPSYREGVPRSTQEAMAIGRAVITTDVPGCRETVIDGLNGFLVPPWSAEVLAEKMMYFINNPEQIEVMGLQSFKLAQENFDARMVNERLMSYFV
ncbi:glycosyltransferase family 4 protein [Pseudomonas chlororaphis]|uniref:glycosyltransferase family 4 protein n=1 Tax=Pseudomonas chlororaphis TaxID=587753 RepID=UPI00236793C9|nr:glycosyltransferase family 4 protein [Pseudomonas chlororaphis]WDH33712.1 glycosyltransferase family 4 protein [Pseudomonas chlororaphis]WDH39796.1 glycosyltransferase family 4 protein [Pseudomonas chlororaphis]